MEIPVFPESVSLVETSATFNIGAQIDGSMVVLSRVINACDFAVKP